MRNVEDKKKIRKSQICNEIERKRESVGNMENTQRVYSMMKKENREREGARKGKEEEGSQRLTKKLRAVEFG